LDNGNGGVDLVGGGTVPLVLAQDVPVIVNPEPGTWALLAMGMGGLTLVHRRRRR
jgi:hypothetical protein